MKNSKKEGLIKYSIVLLVTLIVLPNWMSFNEFNPRFNSVKHIWGNKVPYTINPNFTNALAGTENDQIGAIQRAATTWSNKSNNAEFEYFFNGIVRNITEYQGLDEPLGQVKKKDCGRGERASLLLIYKQNVIFAGALGPDSAGGALTWTCNREILHFDISLNNSITWNSFENSSDGGTDTDLQTVVTHELGHGLGLTHCARKRNKITGQFEITKCFSGTDPDETLPILQRPTMTWQYFGRLGRTLAADDIAGLQALYGRLPWLRAVVFEDDSGADDDKWYPDYGTVYAGDKLEIRFEWSDNNFWNSKPNCNINQQPNCIFSEVRAPLYLNISKYELFQVAVKLDEDDFSADEFYYAYKFAVGNQFYRFDYSEWSVGAVRISVYKN